MPDHPINPHQAATLLGVSVHTVRRWCADYAAYLSPTASPDRGATRRLTQHDITVLQEVSTLRTSEGLNTAQINERLAGLVIPATLDIQPAQPAQGDPHQAQTALVVVEALRSVEARLQSLEEQRPTWRDVILFVLAAFIAGLIVGLAVWWFQ